MLKDARYCIVLKNGDHFSGFYEGKTVDGYLFLLPGKVIEVKSIDVVTIQYSKR